MLVLTVNKALPSLTRVSAEKKIPNSGKAEDISAKIPFFQEQELRQMSASERGHCTLSGQQHYSMSPRGGTATTAPHTRRAQAQNGFTGLITALMSSTLVPCGFGMCHIKQLYEGKKICKCYLKQQLIFCTVILRYTLFFFPQDTGGSICPSRFMLRQFIYCLDYI